MDDIIDLTNDSDDETEEIVRQHPNKEYNEIGSYDDSFKPSRISTYYAMCPEECEAQSSQKKAFEKNHSKRIKPVSPSRIIDVSHDCNEMYLPQDSLRDFKVDDSTEKVNCTGSQISAQIEALNVDEYKPPYSEVKEENVNSQKVMI